MEALLRSIYVLSLIEAWQQNAAELCINFKYAVKFAGRKILQFLCDKNTIKSKLDLGLRDKHWH